MNFSEHSEYMKYIDAIARDDFASAKIALSSCIEDEFFKGSPEKYAFLLQRMGYLCYREGDLDKAISYFAKSESVDYPGLLAKYEFAKFLAKCIGNIPAAVKKCDEVIAAAVSNPSPESEEDMGSDWYASNAENLKREILG